MKRLIAALVLCLSASLALGVEPAQPPQNPFMPQDMQIPDVPLTAASIQKVIASFGRLRAEFGDYQPTDDAQGLQEYVQGDSEAFKKGERIVREGGFEGWQDWAAHFTKMMQTYMAYKMQQAGKVSQAQLDQQIKAVQNDKSLTEEQKQMALSMMSMANMYTQMAAAVPESDLKTLEPFIGQLEQAMQAAKK